MVRLSRRRIHKWLFAPASDPAKARRVPSGESATELLSVSSENPAGRTRLVLVTGAGAEAVRCTDQPRAKIAPAPAARATAAAATLEARRAGRAAALGAGKEPVPVATAPLPAAIHSISLRMSRALCQRSSGSFARQRFSSRSSAGDPGAT